jgi:hypothetical protein
MAHLSVHGSPARRSVMLALALTIAGCATGRLPPSSGAIESRPDLTGVWEGLAADDCSFRKTDKTQCTGVFQIALTLIEQNSNLTGFYKCAAGTIACQREEESGRISCSEVTERRLAFRLTLPDGGSCIFEARRLGESIAGGYFCLGGEIVMGRGRLTVRRSY